jgi:hypothetical protein
MPGFNRLYGVSCKPGPIIEVACWAHARRNFFELARLDKAPIAIEAIKRVDELFAIEPRGAKSYQIVRVEWLTAQRTENRSDRRRSLL